MHTSMENRSLKLKFLDEVSHTVLTGKEIEPKEGPAMRLAIVDNAEKVVTSGPSASAKVEIFLLKVNHDDNEQNWNSEDFNDRIINESDKKKPHFPKNVYVQLKEGIGSLYNVKLGHDSSWMKSCECRLGARSVNKFCGNTVKEAWTKPFIVQDSRSKLYEKHHPPSLHDEVWRLVNIARDGEPCKRLRKEKIFTVQNFLFLLSANPQKLLSIVSDKKINSDSKTWKATVSHAQTCIIDDKKIYLYSSSEFEFTVAFDAIATLRGIIRDSHFVPLDHMSDVEKDRARELILRASENLEDVTSMADEKSVLDRFPYEFNGINSAVDSTILENSLGCEHIDSENNDESGPLETGNSSQTINVSRMQSNDLELHDSQIREQIGGSGPLETSNSSQTISVSRMQSNDLELHDSQIPEQICESGPGNSSQTISVCRMQSNDLELHDSQICESGPCNSSQTISVCRMQSNDLDDSEIRKQICYLLDVLKENQNLSKEFGYHHYFNHCSFSASSDLFSLPQQYCHNEDVRYLTPLPGTCLPKNDEPESSSNTENKALINRAFTLLTVPVWVFRIRKRELEGEETIKFGKNRNAANSGTTYPSFFAVSTA